MKKRLFKTALLLIVILVAGFFIPEKFINPVKGMSTSSYHPESFWYYPWGKSVTHKGVDVFAAEGTDIYSTTRGVVIFTGKWGRGGNVIMVLGPKWRIHYYAHLQEIRTKTGAITEPGELIGTVGTTGNAKGKPAHLHYSIITPVPYPWRADNDIQGWRKMFYLNPIAYFNYQ